MSLINSVFLRLYYFLLLFFIWPELDSSESIPSAYFPSGTQEFLRINSRYTGTYFGAKPSLDVCKSQQAATQDSYMVYSDLLKTTYKIRRTQDVAVIFKGVPVHQFEVDTEHMYGVNNMSVFTRGLIDLSKTKGGLPFLASSPHYLEADASLPKKFGMQPDKTKHKSIVSSNVYFFVYTCLLHSVQ